MGDGKRDDHACVRIDLKTDVEQQIAARRRRLRPEQWLIQYPSLGRAKKLLGHSVLRASAARASSALTIFKGVISGLPGTPRSINNKTSVIKWEAEIIAA